MAQIPQFDQEQFNTLVLQHSVIQFLAEPIEVADGRRSHVDVAWQTAFESKEALHDIADHIISFANNLGFTPDIFTAASPDTELLIPVVQEKWNILRGRENKPLSENPKALVIHDTTILGRIVMGGVETARKNGAQVIGAISLIDRNELRNEKRTASQFIASYGVPYYSMSGLLSLLPQAFSRYYENGGYISDKETLATAIEVYFRQYGTKQIKLL
jgi:hypothetical protein